MSRISIFFLCTATLAMAGCQNVPLRDLLGLGGGDGNGEPRPGQEERDHRALNQMREEIYALVGDAPCESESDCHFIGLGAKPCGGPWEYLIFSTAYTQARILRDMVGRYNEFEAEMNRAYGYVSDCAFAAEPEVGCVEGYCVDLGHFDSLPPQPDVARIRFIDSFDELRREPGLHDPYQLDGLFIDGDILGVAVGFSGGCEYHDFQLWATEDLDDRDPPVQTLHLTHDANGDVCEAFLQETRHFNLAPLRRLHRDREEVVLILGDRRTVLEF